MIGSKKRKPKPALTEEHAKRDYSNDRVVIAAIHPGQWSAYFGVSLVATILRDQAKENPNIVGMLQEWSSANVSAPRNKLTTQFLDEYDADWLMWIDSDMQFGPLAIDELLAVADPVERPIVGGLCFGMSEGKLFPTIYMLAQDDEEHNRPVRLGNYPPNKVVKVAGTGAAFVLIHRSALEKIRAAEGKTFSLCEHGSRDCCVTFSKTFPFFEEIELHNDPVGEDITFSLRALFTGSPMHVHTGVKIGHHKSQLLDEQLFLFQVATSGEDEAEGNAAARG